MDHISKFINPSNIPINLEQSQLLLSQMNYVFICKSDDAEKVINQAIGYYSNNPGVDYE